MLKSLQVKFDQFVEQGRVLHNYASILELLLRLRQCCDHPFLVMRYVSYLPSLPLLMDQYNLVISFNDFLVLFSFSI
jgi:SNF2 family DNA or RNA helicase